HVVERLQVGETKAQVIGPGHIATGAALPVLILPFGQDRGVAIRYTDEVTVIVLAVEGISDTECVDRRPGLRSKARADLPALVERVRAAELDLVTVIIGQVT